MCLDSPKPSAGATIRQLTEAGIAIKVLTGDGKTMSRHVFAEIGVLITGVLTGEALTHLSEEALLGQAAAQTGATDAACRERLCRGEAPGMLL